MKKDKAVMIAAAAAAILSTTGVEASQDEKGGKKNRAKAAVACTGVHGCGGKSVCSGHGNASCAGQNSCGGKGFIKIVTGDLAFSKELCKKLGGVSHEYMHKLRKKRKKNKS